MPIKKAIRDLAKEFAETYPFLDKSKEFPHKEMEKLKKSGGLAFFVPKEYGGLGRPFVDVIEATMTLAEGNPAIAQMYAGHCIIGAQLILDLAPEPLRKRLFKEIIENNAFVANAASEKQSKNVLAWETVFIAAPSEEGVHIRGKKFFCTGSLASDLILVTGMLNDNVSIAFARRDQEGMVFHNDWDVMGQRGTASGTIDFNDVFVPSDMLIPMVGDGTGPDPTDLFAPMMQTCFSAIHVGAAKGALQQAINYVKTKTRPWVESGVASAIEDPYILRGIGKQSSYVAAAESLVMKAARSVEGALERRKTEGRDEMARLRAETMAIVAQAKVVSTEMSLWVCQDIFQVSGARAALAAEDMDRFWRDVRTLTLHDPVDYKLKLIGEFLLQGKYPSPTFYN